MKRSRFLLTVFVSALLIAPGIAFTDTSQITICGVDLARVAAQKWLDDVSSVASLEIPQWHGANATKSQSFYNLNGELNAYLFTIENRGVAGYILVGGPMYEYSILQAGTANPPASEYLVIAKATQEELGFEVDKLELNKNVEFIYTGIDGFFAVYEIDNTRVAINLINGEAMPLSDLKMSMPSPEQYLYSKKLIQPLLTRTTGYNTLNMSYWRGDGRYRCGPCSGVSIGAYYRDYCGYDDLFESNEDMYDSLYYLIGTYLNFGATFPWDYGPGFWAMTIDCGYGIGAFDWAYNASPDAGDYWTIVSDIDNGWPYGLCILSEWHWRAISGYYWVEDWQNVYSIVCTNSATSDSFEFLDWLQVINETCWLVDVQNT